jgi:hypothetical protein
MWTFIFVQGLHVIDSWNLSPGMPVNPASFIRTQHEYLDSESTQLLTMKHGITFSCATSHTLPQLNREKKIAISF